MPGEKPCQRIWFVRWPGGDSVPGPGSTVSHRRRDREDVVAEPVQDERLLDADRVRRAVLVEPDDDALAGSTRAGRSAGEIGSGPATFGASGGVCGSTCGGQGSDTVRAPAAHGTASAAAQSPSEERPPAQRRCSIGTSVADSGSSLTGLYVMPSNFAK